MSILGLFGPLLSIMPLYFMSANLPAGSGSPAARRQTKLEKICRDEDPDSEPVGSADFWPVAPDPDPKTFSTDPDPTCINGFINLFLSWTKYKPESTNSSIKWWFKISNFMPTYLKHKYIFFFISISGRIRNIFPSKPDPDPDPWKKMSDPHPWLDLIGNPDLIGRTSSPVAADQAHQLQRGGSGQEW